MDGTKLGKFTDQDSLDEIMHGQVYQEYRRSLLLGELQGNVCAECPVAYPISIDEYQMFIEDYTKFQR